MSGILPLKLIEIKHEEPLNAWNQIENVEYFCEFFFFIFIILRPCCP